MYKNTELPKGLQNVSYLFSTQNYTIPDLIFYSAFKLGVLSSVYYYANMLYRSLASHPAFKEGRVREIVCAPNKLGPVMAVNILARRFSEISGLKLINLSQNRRRSSRLYYDLTYMERMSRLSKEEEIGFPDSLPREREVMFLDDSLASGAMVDAATKVILREGLGVTTVYPVVVANLGGRSRLEKPLDFFFLHYLLEHELLDPLIKLFKSDLVIPTTRTVTALYRELDYKMHHRVVSSLSLREIRAFDNLAADYVRL